MQCAVCVCVWGGGTIDVLGRNKLKGGKVHLQAGRLSALELLKVLGTVLIVTKCSADTDSNQV